MKKKKKLHGVLIDRQNRVFEWNRCLTVFNLEFYLTEVYQT